MKSNIKPDYHYYLKTASNPSVSPDGTSVAATIQETPKGSVKPTSDIWVFKTDGSDTPRKLTQTGTAGKPSWSLDGTWLTFIDKAPGGLKQIFRMGANGQDQEQ